MAKALKIVGITLGSVALILAAGLALILVFARPNDHSDRMTVASGLPNFHQVDPYLYRGAAPTPVGIQTLKELGVKTIIDFRVNPQMVQAERVEAQQLGIRYINLPIAHCNITPECEKAFFETVSEAAADPANGSVFVHCAHGSDRTGLLIGMWRVQHDKWSYLAAAQEALHYGFFFHRFLGT
jgi:protein tyrosine/serine phosphatase